jgi:hypothetical protein
MEPQTKKRKIEKKPQTAVECCIERLNAIDFTISNIPESLGADLIVSLKPGIGLLGNAEEVRFHAPRT